MPEVIHLACEREVILVPLKRLLPTRLLDEGVRKTSKYKCIEASIRELGVIEPLVVFRKSQVDGAYILLDGHLRHMVLMDMHEASVKCLIATDDEGFTYNHKVSRLSAVQEHFMVLRAIKSGASESRIAKALNLDIYKIRQKRDLLEGICSEAVALLKDSRANASTFRELRKVRPMRQIEIAELMCAASNFSVGYAKCLVTTSSDDQLLDGNKGKEPLPISPEEMARLEREMECLGREFKLIEETHGQNTLHLVIVLGYLKKLLNNAAVVKFLSKHYADILAEFQKLAESKGLQDAVSDSS